MYKVKRYVKTSVSGPSEWEGVLDNGKEFSIKWGNEIFSFFINGKKQYEYRLIDSDRDREINGYWTGDYMSTEEAFRRCKLGMVE
tara:strand:+ start:2368 stop:2622 length:255 start_codon:yes stop_codon:yes gene_type:complete